MLQAHKPRDEVIRTREFFTRAERLKRQSNPMVAVVRRLVAVTLALQSILSAQAFAPSGQSKTSFPTKLGVASAESRVDISDLGRGMGGRIEEAFAAAKAKGEAAFVTFVTAGYPKAKGRYKQQRQ